MKKRISIYLSVVLIGLVVISCGEDQPTPANLLNGKTTAIFNPRLKYGSVTDVDGNVYKTIKIGNQTWMAENLRTTRYRNGDAIPNVTDTTEWATTKACAYCNYNNTISLDTIATYGRLYNWYAVADERQIAPKGWRVADIADWDILIEYLGGDTVAGDKMKEIGSTHWEDPYYSDNSSGFTALPGGWRYLSQNCKYVGYYGVWWASSGYNEEVAGFLYLNYYASKVWRGLNIKNNGYSVRCIKE